MPRPWSVLTMIMMMMRVTMPMLMLLDRTREAHRILHYQCTNSSFLYHTRRHLRACAIQ